MGWRERDYSQASWREPRRIGGIRLPPTVTLVLLAAHGVLFVALQITRAETGPALDSWTRLGGRVESGPARSEAPAAAASLTPLRATGVLLHPVGTNRVLTLIFVVVTLWILAGPLESRIGGGRVLLLYVAGSLLAGAAFYAVAALAPTLGATALDYPVGAFAAWCLASWWVFADDFLIVFGKVSTRAKLIAIFAAVSVGLTLLLGGFGALAWLAAVALAVLAAYLLPLLEWRAAPRRARPVAARAPRERPIRVPVRVNAGLPDAAAAAPPARRAIEIDDILAKISREGLAALTPAERSRLESARQAMLDEGFRETPG